MRFFLVGPGRVGRRDGSRVRAWVPPSPNPLPPTRTSSGAPTHRVMAASSPLMDLEVRQKFCGDAASGGGAFDGRTSKAAKAPINAPRLGVGIDSSKRPSCGA